MSTNDLRVIIIGAGKYFPMAEVIQDSQSDQISTGITGLIVAQGLKRVPTIPVIPPFEGVAS